MGAGTVGSPEQIDHPTRAPAPRTPLGCGWRSGCALALRGAPLGLRADLDQTRGSCCGLADRLGAGVEHGIAGVGHPHNGAQSKRSGTAKRPRHGALRLGDCIRHATFPRYEHTMMCLFYTTNHNRVTRFATLFSHECAAFRAWAVLFPVYAVILHHPHRVIAGRQQPEDTVWTISKRNIWA